MDFDNEGSSEVDTGNLPTVTNQDESKDEIEIRNEDQSNDEETKSKDEGEVEGEEEKQSVKTEKGTNLDPNPLSAAHQQLANERRVRENYEKVLQSPDLLRKYAKEAGMTLEEAKAEIKEDQKTYTPESLKSAADVANILNEMQSSFRKEVGTLKEENQSLRSELSGLSSSRRVEHVAATMQSDISSVQEKYPQLNPNSPEYDKELENEIGSFYHELDAIDPSDPSKGYKGLHSLAKITDRFMRVRGVGAKSGSQKAQTDVKVKQSGRVVTASKSSPKETVSSDAGTSIAQKIEKTLKGN